MNTVLNNLQLTSKMETMRIIMDVCVTWKNLSVRDALDAIEAVREKEDVGYNGNDLLLAISKSINFKSIDASNQQRVTVSRIAAVMIIEKVTKVGVKSSLEALEHVAVNLSDHKDYDGDDIYAAIWFLQTHCQ